MNFVISKYDNRCFRSAVQLSFGLDSLRSLEMWQGRWEEIHIEECAAVQ